MIQGGLSFSSNYRNAADGDHLSRTTSLPSSTSFTICAWIRLIAKNGSWASLFGLENGTTNAADSIFLGHNASNVLMIYSSFNGSISFGTDYPAGSTFFAAIACSGTGVGSLIGYARRAWEPVFQTSSTQGTSFTPALLRIGQNSYSGEFEDANFHDCRVWNAALTASELLSESHSPVPVRRPGLHAWWPLEGNTNQLIYDRSSNGRHLTRAGAGRSEPMVFPRRFTGRRNRFSFVDAGAPAGQPITKRYGGVPGMGRGTIFGPKIW